MIINQEFAGSKGSLKLGYSRGLPSYMAPKLFDNKKTEEYFVSTLYAQVLLYNKIRVIGVEVCEDDSNKGADVIIKILDTNPKEIQVTRFTLTEYLRRRRLAEEKVEKLIDIIQPIVKLDNPVNISFNVHNNAKIPLNNQKILNDFAKLIANLISKNYEVLKSTNHFINCEVNE
ncbi:MAG: hypothetical protein GY756_22795 [bacterium]|nr:hypothetical protein [bacterium]